jgi:hypothetical protein
MWGFKNFEPATITIAGIELLRRVRKDQFTLGSLRFKDQTVPALWNAILARLGASTATAMTGSSGERISCAYLAKRTCTQRK